MKHKNTNAPSARARERRLPVGGLCEEDSRRAAKTEYVMRLLVRGRAPLEEPAAPAPKKNAAAEGMTLENLTFDDLLAELEKL